MKSKLSQKLMGNATKDFIITQNQHLMAEFIGNDAKRGISKRVLQENKARQIFGKTNISYPLIRRYADHEVRNVRLSRNLACFVFL